MDDRTRGLLRKVMEKYADLGYIEPDDIPDIPLYMDQITTFMDSKFSDCKRRPEDKILTKTMINNYTKNKLIPPPDRKKYSKEHLILLIYVYYLKDFLSIPDIKTLLAPLEDNHFQTEEGLSMQDIYETAFRLVRGQTGYISKDLLRRWKLATQAFPEASSGNEEYLQIFAFVCLLSFDVYVKKKLIEALVDAMNQENSSAEAGGSPKKNSRTAPGGPADSQKRKERKAASPAPEDSGPANKTEVPASGAPDAAQQTW